MIKNFLLETESINSILLVLGIAMILSGVAMTYAVGFYFIFRKEWKNTLSTLVSEVNVNGLDFINSLIEIAKIKTKGESLFKLGMIKQTVENHKEDENFFQKILELIEKIHDNNHTMVLNSDYARARDEIRNAIGIIEKYSTIVGIKEFAEFSVAAKKCQENLEISVKKLDGILYSLQPHEDALFVVVAEKSFQKTEKLSNTCDILKMPQLK